MAKSTAQNVCIIDCQLLQTKAWHRGMGKYTARTIEAWMSSQELVDNNGTIVLLFNEQLAFEDDLRQFVESLPHASHTFLHLDVPNYDDLSSITNAQQANRIALDNHIELNFPNANVSFLITSLFLDEACPTFPTNAYKAIIYYDLIPLMYVRKYLGYGSSEQFFTRFSVMYDADMVFAISETVANDLTNFLGYPADRIVNIYGSSNQVAPEREGTRPHLAIDRPFIIMPTGGDPRKNNEFGVRAFEKFNYENADKYQLVITSYFNDDQKTKLRGISENIVFSDNVSDDELWWLYKNSLGMLFPSEYEGLGMPVLEAMDAGKLVACSDIAVFREISEDAFYMFSPYSLDEAVAALYAMIFASKKDITEKKRHYEAIQKTYTWLHTATVISSYMSERAKVGSLARGRKPKIAIVAPHVCEPSDVGFWATNQYLSLSNMFDVEYYYEILPNEQIVRPSYLAFVAKTHNILELTPERYEGYATVVYIYDNARRSSLTVLAALGLPGVFIQGTDDVSDAYDMLVANGYMSPQRRDMLTPRTLAERSCMYVDAGSKEGLKTSGVAINLPKLPYPMPHRPSVNRRVVVPMTGRVEDDNNARYIKTLLEIANESLIEVSIISRVTMDESAREIVSACPIDIQEKLTDHEYFSAIMRADLYVDATSIQTLEHRLMADAARNLDVPVLVYQHDVSAEDVVQQTLRWVIDPESVKKNFAQAPNKGDAFTDYIQRTVKPMGEKD